MIDSKSIQQQVKYKILLIGDNCLDVYQYGTVDRLSPEAPVPVFVPTYKQEKNGMAGNVYSNLINLGCEVDLICGQLSKKTRLVDSKSKHHILRIDEDVKSSPLTNVSTSGYDAVVISDYDKGLVNYELIEQVILSQIPIFIDTKKTDLHRMQGAFVKINELEYNKLKTTCTDLIVTKGEKGAVMPFRNIKLSASNVEVVDVTGAGDTFLAALTYKWLETKIIEESIKFAISAASITVQHFGCYAPKLEEIV